MTLPDNPPRSMTIIAANCGLASIRPGCIADILGTLVNRSVDADYHGVNLKFRPTDTEGEFFPVLIRDGWEFRFWSGGKQCRTPETKEVPDDFRPTANHRCYADQIGFADLTVTMAPLDISASPAADEPPAPTRGHEDMAGEFLHMLAKQLLDNLRIICAKC